MLISAMSAGLATPAQPSAAARHMRMLSRLAEAGVNIALDLETQIHAGTPPPLDPAGPPPHPLDFIDPHSALAMARANADLALAFARVSRAVRLCIALHDRLEKDEEVPARARRTGAAVSAPIVPDAKSDTPDIETLAQTLQERLHDREFPETLLGRPVEELIALICAELGLPIAGRVAVAQPQTGGITPPSGARPHQDLALADLSNLAGATPPVRPAAGHPPRFGGGKGRPAPT
jgi:hypothetical protein